ncbi:MAG: hypothetical protein V2J62_10515 [candidate division KSB1 bacterium]|nr:hypothetical protein [candidate division KSB1 bacterium]
MQDASERDRTTARRVHLIAILWEERYLTREQLITRLEGILGKDCFGESAWEDTFYRDMRVIKQAFLAAGYDIKYSRSSGQSGYYIDGHPPLSENITQIIQGSIKEVDQDQIAAIQQLSVQDRIKLGLSISEAALDVIAYRHRQKRPALSIRESKKIVLEDMRSNERRTSGIH